jgi:hypothetical protein
MITLESEYINRKVQLVTYLQLHVQSLNEDLSQLSNKMDSLDPASKDFAELDIEYNYTSGQVSATMHILEYVEEIM